MNKKIILYYFLIALILIICITDSIYAALTAKFDVDKTLAFWTSERIKSAKPLIPENIEFRNETTSGTKNVTDNDQQLVMPPLDNTNNPFNYPVGRLLFSDPKTGRAQSCTASMINTENGNIGITAAHCLFDNNGVVFNYMSFSPGYDSGIPGPLGLIPVEFVIAPPKYLERPDIYDYGMIRMNFNDPSGYKLQQYTGANGWILGVKGDNILTTILGYPFGGDMPNCERDALHLCVFVGNAKSSEPFYVIPDVNLGVGASGAPMTIEHNINRNLGYTYSNHANYDRRNHECVTPIYNPEDFNNLLESVSNDFTMFFNH